MKKLLLLGGSHAEIPLIKAAKEMGYYVITSGNQRNGIGHPLADEYAPCDFSDKEAITSLAEQLQVDAICSGCNDFAALSAAYASERLGLGGHDDYQTSLKLHHKDQYRQLAEKLDIATPKAYRCESQEQLQQISEKMVFPVIVKPVDLTGGKGIRRCDTLEELQSAYDEAVAITRESFVIVEQFITGTNHGFSAYLQNEQVVFAFADNEQYYHNPYLVSGASTPGDIPTKARQQLIDDCEKIAHDLHLCDGILHIQLILTEENVPVIIEICRRTPGDLYVELVHKATGMEYAKYIVGAEAGLKMPRPEYHQPTKYYVRHCVMADHDGVVDGIDVAAEIRPFIVDQLSLFHKGETISEYLKYKAAIVFLCFATKQQYMDYIDKLPQMLTIRYRLE